MKKTCRAATILLAGTFVLSCLAGDNPTAEPKRPSDAKPLYDEKADAKADIKAALRVPSAKPPRPDPVGRRLVHLVRTDWTTASGPTPN